MKFRLLLLGLGLAMCMPSFAQDGIDVTQLLADTKTFIFNNNKNTVKGYIYDQLEVQTSCCGSDRIYLEVKIDPSGYVLQVKTLTGKNECFKKSAIDIVKNVKWDAGDFRGPKSVYFEIKPNIDCEGGRENNYAQIEIFNNEKLDTQGNRVYDQASSASTVASNTPPKQETPPPPPPEKETPVADPVVRPADLNKTTSEEVAVNEPENKAEEAAPEEKAEPLRTDNESRGSVANTEVQSQPQTEPQTEPENDEQTPASASLPLTSTRKPSPITEADRERMAAKRKADQADVAQEEEINYLRDQLEVMRKREEELREARLAEARAQRERERELAAQQEESYEDSYTDSGDDDSGEGGLFFDNSGGDDTDYSDDSALASEDTDPPKAQSEEERLRDNISSIEQRIRDLEQSRVDRETRIREEQDAITRDNEMYLQLVEEKFRAEEDYNRNREQQELDRMEKDRMAREDDRRRVEDESQRLMDEIQRLQQEMETKIVEIEQQKEELDRLAELKIRREQEIVLEQAIREKEREAELERLRISLFGGVANNSGSSPTDIANSNEDIDMSMFPPDFLESEGEDSTKLRYLMRVITNLNDELASVRTRLAQLEGGGSSSTSFPQNPATVSPRNNTGSSSGVRTPASGTGNDLPKFKRADENDSWRDVDNGIEDPIPSEPDPPVRTNNNPVVTNTNPQTTPPVVNNEPQNTAPEKTHSNSSGPKFVPRAYVNGESAMKSYINGQLRNGNICGLAQSAFSVTLDPSGNVVDHRILAANKASVEDQLNRIIPGLKFNSANIRINQTVYLEFKADIRCEGFDSGKNIKDLKPLINNN